MIKIKKKCKGMKFRDLIQTAAKNSTKLEKTAANFCFFAAYGVVFEFVAAFGVVYEFGADVDDSVCMIEILSFVNT